MQFVRAISSGNFSMFGSLGGLYVYYDLKSTLAVEISFVKYKVFQWNQYPVLKKDRNRISVIQKLHDGLISKFFINKISYFRYGSISSVLLNSNIIQFKSTPMQI